MFVLIKRKTYDFFSDKLLGDVPRFGDLDPWSNHFNTCVQGLVNFVPSTIIDNIIVVGVTVFTI